ncbi:MAG: HIT family protein [Patescibacteria group bacterium]|nr:HIT family protein [Patescibacteria group bacterium]MDD4304306.1 HIT family protein [Patescibacteria group bacterium]MDD4695667.1 HIT family protein [Patescibacteria group bacterium]
MDCVFCKIIKGEIPSLKIYEDDDCLAFLDINPINEGHTLVVPKKHYDTFLNTPIEEIEKLINVIYKIAPKIKKSLNADAFNIGLNNGKEAGQIIFHTHFHIIPRFNDDNLANWENKTMNQEELENISKKIQNNI